MIRNLLRNCNPNPKRKRNRIDRPEQPTIPFRNEIHLQISTTRTIGKTNDHYMIVCALLPSSVWYPILQIRPRFPLDFGSVVVCFVPFSDLLSFILVPMLLACFCWSVFLRPCFKWSAYPPVGPHLPQFSSSIERNMCVRNRSYPAYWIPFIVVLQQFGYPCSQCCVTKELSLTRP